MPAARHVAMNRVYTGGWETQAAGARIRAAADASRAARGVWPHVGAYMAEFAREALLDPPALAALRGPGTVGHRGLSLAWPRSRDCLRRRTIAFAEVSKMN